MTLWTHIHGIISSVYVFGYQTSWNCLILSWILKLDETIHSNIAVLVVVTIIMQFFFQTLKIQLFSFKMMWMTMYMMLYCWFVWFFKKCWWSSTFRQPLKPLYYCEWEYTAFTKKLKNLLKNHEVHIMASYSKIMNWWCVKWWDLKKPAVG